MDLRPPSNKVIDPTSESAVTRRGHKPTSERCSFDDCFFLRTAVALSRQTAHGLTAEAPPCPPPGPLSLHTWQALPDEGPRTPG